MPDYSIRIATFEGPLDLLMHLLDKDKLDIYDIPIVEITEQYISYLNTMREYDVDIASDFLVMAATLLQIKSRMLLPKLPAASGEENSDPRQFLIEMLLEYKKVKLQASLLAEARARALRQHYRQPAAAVGAVRKIKQMDYSKLLEALLKLMRPEDIPPAVIERQKFNVQDKMREIERVLQVEGGSIAFASFFTSENNRGEIIALFLALLELLRLKRIIVRQTVPFASIYVFLREDQSDVL